MKRLAARALLATFCIAGFAPGIATAADVQVKTETSTVVLTEVARGLENPWSLAFLPDGRLLVTERPGRMRLVSPSGALSAPLAGLPAVHASGQGGLLDVVLSPGFATDRLIYFSFAQPTAGGARTAVARARLDADALRLQDLRGIFAQKDDPPGGHHFGSRLVFGRDGTLFVTLGERFNHRDRAQDLDSHLGKVVRINPDGSVPADNPFVGRAGALPEIWSYGHRNVQGAALAPDGTLWTHEHGPMGGDEINLPQAGKNYGWPLVSFGLNYEGTPVGTGQSAAPGLEPPLHHWTPSIAPSGMAFLTSDRYGPAWQGNLFVGSLKFQYLDRIELKDGRVVAEHPLLQDLGQRIRDVRQGPDGLLYVLTDSSDGRLLRLLSNQ